MQEHMIRRPFNAVLETVAHMSQTPANYWAEFALDIPLGVMLIYAGGMRRFGIHPFGELLTIVIGLVLFSFVEYIVHRKLFHGSSIQPLVVGHQRHHDDPMGYDALPFFLPALVVLSLTAALLLFLPVGYAFLLSGSAALGYVTYGLSHFAIHHMRFRRHLVKQWAAHHHIHHRHPTSNFGVTTPLWDLVFGTRFAWSVPE